MITIPWRPMAVLVVSLLGCSRDVPLPDATADLAIGQFPDLADWSSGLFAECASFASDTTGARIDGATPLGVLHLRFAWWSQTNAFCTPMFLFKEKDDLKLVGDHWNPPGLAVGSEVHPPGSLCSDPPGFPSDPPCRAIFSFISDDGRVVDTEGLIAGEPSRPWQGGKNTPYAGVFQAIAPGWNLRGCFVARSENALNFVAGCL